MRNSAGEEKLREKQSEADRAAVDAKVRETTEWLNANQLAEKDEFEAKQQELEAVCNPIMSKAYQPAAGAGAGEGGAEPTIDEVD